MASYIDCSPSDYHKRDGFSSSLAKTLLAQSPLHAWQEHPLLGGETAEPDDPTACMDRGAIIHHLVLGKGADFVVLNFDDWRTNRAKDARDAARAEHKIPVLTSKYEDASKAADAIKSGLADRAIRLDGESEQAMEWTETTDYGGVLCRGMMDHVTASRLIIYDLKIVESAAPAAIERTAESFGHAIQHAAYMSGNAACLRAAGRSDAEVARMRMLFIYAEPHKPYGMVVGYPDGEMVELGIRRWRRAVNSWARCLSDKQWPGYDAGISRLSAPPWAYSSEPLDMEEVR